MVKLSLGFGMTAAVPGPKPSGIPPKLEGHQTHLQQRNNSESFPLSGDWNSSVMSRKLALSLQDILNSDVYSQTKRQPKTMIPSLLLTQSTSLPSMRPPLPMHRQGSCQTPLQSSSSYSILLTVPPMRHTMLATFRNQPHSASNQIQASSNSTSQSTPSSITTQTRAQHMQHH